MGSKKRAEVVFVPDQDVGVVVNCFSNVKIEQSKRKNKTPQKSIWTPKKVGTPRTPTVTKSGRKITSRYDNLNVTILARQEPSSDEGSGFSDIEPLEDCSKPSALYDDDDALGKELFGFQTPRKKSGMLAKASEAVGQMRKVPEKKSDPTKTPHAARAKIKNRIIEEAKRQKILDELEESESDYEPSSDSSESEESETETQPFPVEKRTNKEITIARRPRPEINPNFMCTSDEYFERKNTRTVTSNHTLSKLKNPKIRQDQLTSLLKSISTTHEAAIDDLNSCNKAMFKRWLFSMSEGYNILVYGVGSKKKLLDDFRDGFLQNSPTVVVNGFFPGMTAKMVVDCVAGDLLKMKNVPVLPHEALEAIAERQKSSSANRVFVIVHNIESGLLKCEKNQAILSHLASIAKVHMIASMDHINGPLVWDQKKLSDFNFVWEDGTSFLPYLEETSYESSLMVQRSGVIALSALKNVYQSLTSNTREVFKKLIHHQLDHPGKQYPGMMFSELYRECRDSFIVSSDLALRTQLTEFIDHQIVKWKKDSDHLIIPIDNSVLKQFKSDVIEEN